MKSLQKNDEWQKNYSIFRILTGTYTGLCNTLQFLFYNWSLFIKPEL